jgi:hypothetical protein
MEPIDPIKVYSEMKEHNVYEQRFVLLMKLMKFDRFLHKPWILISDYNKK